MKGNYAACFRAASPGLKSMLVDAQAGNSCVKRLARDSQLFGCAVRAWETRISIPSRALLLRRDPYSRAIFGRRGCREPARGSARRHRVSSRGGRDTGGDREGLGEDLAARTDLQYVGPFLHQRISGFSLSRNWPGTRLLVVLTIRTISMLERHDRKKWQALNNLTVAKFLTARWRCPGRVAKRLRQFRIWSKRPAWLLGVDLRNRSRRSVIRRYLELCGTPLRTAPFFLVESRASSLRRRSFILGPLN